MDYYTTQIEEEFGKIEWHEVYSFLEFLYERLDPIRQTGFVDGINKILREEGAQYEMVDGKILRLMSKEEAKIVSDIQNQNTSASDHITKAIGLFNKRPNPDYSNSIKESISAVEAVVRDITGDQSVVLSEGVKKLGLHNALEQGIIKLYAWTSDEGGIRHSSKEAGTPPSEADARYMLVQCSMLVTYLSDKQRT
jgi:hypothetical protein